ncbi:MAG: DUF4340 domain-containing protein [Mariniblastus sp.]|nr:DUF4340 domain-containing protein [Mariniblastus sp.]
MKSPLFKTAVMAMLTAVVVVVASAFYPWPEPVVESDLVGKPLFESYVASTVRTIKIVEFDRDRESIRSIVLERSGEQWTIPAMQKFVATNPTQVSFATKALNELTVLEEVTSERQAFLDYGVVDPSDYDGTTNRTALGTKLILEDRKGREIASLIVGLSRKSDQSQDRKSHFVRIPGQPTVYLVDFDERVLSTDFTRWVDPNLFALSGAIPGLITIEDYRIDPSPANGNIKPTRRYRSELVFRDGRISMTAFEVPDASGNYQEMEPSPELASQVQVVGNQIGNIRFPDVQRKPATIAKALKKPLQSTDAAVFKPLEQVGFVNTGFKNGTHQFDAINGEVSVGTADGVVTTLYIGDVAKNAVSDTLRVSLHVMICSGVDESLLPEIAKPADAQDKEYLRKVQQRNEILKSAKIRASELNQRHASWFYLVPENVIEVLRPEVDVSMAKPKVSEAEKKSDADKSDADKPDADKPDADSSEVGADK